VCKIFQLSLGLMVKWEGSRLSNISTPKNCNVQSLRFMKAAVVLMYRERIHSNNVLLSSAWFSFLISAYVRGGACSVLIVENVKCQLKITVICNVTKGTTTLHHIRADSNVHSYCRLESLISRSSRFHLI
jgi:hypothetical protein